MAKKLIRKVLSVVSFGKLGGEGTPCGFCPLYIFEEHEAGGVIHYKDGKPACARCRILSGKMGATIAGDKSKRDDQIAAIEKDVQKKADAEALELAERTQRETQTKR